MAVGLAVYFVGSAIAMSISLGGRDPFPGVPDIFYLAFYPAIFTGVLFLIRARAMRVPWARFALDATIFVVGFGVFFWFLVDSARHGDNRDRLPQAGAQPELRRAQLRAGARASACC